MANTVITYPAQKLNIKCMRGHHFKLVVNIKNADGSNYDFTSNADDSTDTDSAYIVIKKSNGDSVYNSTEDSESLDGLNIGVFIGKTVEDGKITFEWNNPSPFSPWPGRYKYHIYTVDDVSNTNTRIWLYGDFIVVDNNTWVVEDAVI